MTLDPDSTVARHFEDLALRTRPTPKPEPQESAR